MVRGRGYLLGMKGSAYGEMLMGTRIDWRRARVFRSSETTREDIYGPRSKGRVERWADKFLALNPEAPKSKQRKKRKRERH